MKKKFNAIRALGARRFGQITATAAGVGAAIQSAAYAAINTSEVSTALDAAQASGEGVGAKVIAVVAGLVVVGVIIGLVRKL